MAGNIKPKCSICGQPYEGYGNNAQPINDGRCCDQCNADHVVIRRMEDARKERELDRNSR